MAHIIQPHARQFGTMLREMFEQHGLRNTATIGQLVASAQHSPSREDFPYDAAVVEAWYSGELLPTPEAFTAISEMCHSRTNGSDCEALELAYEAAEADPHPRHLTELSVTLRARLKASGLSLGDMAKAMTAINEPIGSTIASATVLLSEASSGKKTFSPQRLAGCDKVFSHLGISGPPLATLYDLSRIEQSDATYIPPTAPDGTFGSMLKACRQRLGFSTHRMAAAIGDYTGKPISHMAIHNWERGGLPSRDSLPGTDAVTVYGTLLTQAELTQADDAQPAVEPWWTAAREQEMRTAHAEALKVHHHAAGRPLAPAYQRDH